MAKSAHQEEGVGDLMKSVVEDVGKLVKIEIALAKQEVRYDVTQLKNAAIAFGLAAVGVTVALSLLLVGLLVALGGGAGGAIALAAIVLGLSTIAAAVGYRMIPRSPTPEKTAKHVVKQAKMLKERIA